MRSQASIPFQSSDTGWVLFSLVTMLQRGNQHATAPQSSYDLNRFTDSDIEETVMARVVLRKLPSSAFQKKGRVYYEGEVRGEKM